MTRTPTNPHNSNKKTKNNDKEKKQLWEIVFLNECSLIKNTNLKNWRTIYINNPSNYLYAFLLMITDQIPPLDLT